jgi:hypothetical protein
LIKGEILFEVKQLELKILHILKYFFFFINYILRLKSQFLPFFYNEFGSIGGFAFGSIDGGGVPFGLLIGADAFSLAFNILLNHLVLFGATK